MVRVRFRLEYNILSFSKRRVNRILSWLGCLPGSLALPSLCQNFQDNYGMEITALLLSASTALPCIGNDKPSMDQTCFSCTSHICSIGLRSWEFGGQVNTLNSWLCSLNHSWTIFAVWQGTFSSWKRPRPSGKTISMKGCTWSPTMIKWVVHVKVHAPRRSQEVTKCVGAWLHGVSFVPIGREGHPGETQESAWRRLGVSDGRTSLAYSSVYGTMSLTCF